MPVSITTAAMPNKLIMAILGRGRGCAFMVSLRWYLSVDFASMAIKLIAHAVAVATLTSFGIWRMLRAGDLVSLVSPRPASIVATEEIRPVD
jgi:hypothetical protein